MSFEGFSPYESLFDSFFSRAKQTIPKNDQIFELLPLFYVVSDLAVIGSKKDRYAFSDHAQDIILSELSQCAPYLSPSWLDDRIDLYATVLRSGNVRAEWFLGDKSILSDNPLVVCCSVFGDLIWNPSCASDYFNSSFLLTGINDYVQFANVILHEILPCMTDYYKSVYDLPDGLQSLTAPAPDPVISSKPVSENNIKGRFSQNRFLNVFKRNVPLYSVLILSLFFVVVCLVVAGVEYDYGYRNGHSSGYSSGYDDGYESCNSALQSRDEPDTIEPESEPEPEESIVFIEAAPRPEPASGVILTGHRYDNQSEITVTADSQNSYVVKLKRVDGSDILSFYVQAGDTVTVPVPSKQMYVYFASGTTWYGKDYLFGEDTFYSKDDELLDFSQYTFSYTLYPVTNGNFSETPIDASEFG